MKEALFRAVIERDMDISRSISEAPKIGGADPVSDITELGLFMVDQLRKRSRVFKLVLSDASRLGLDEFSKHIPGEALAKLESIFGLLGATDPRITALAFQSFLLRAVLFEAFLGKDPFVELDRSTIGRLAALLVNGMGGE